MCGIVGLLSKHGTFSFYCDGLFTHMLQMDSIRGPDSTGVFGIATSGHVDSIKGNADGWTFTKSKQYETFKSNIKNYKVVVGHNRKATVGAVTAENAHPFREKHIIMVHNGTLRGTSGLKDTEVDSHAICHALADHNAVEALEKINGAYALVWYDASDRTLNLARNSERPLSIIEYASIWCISSEVGLPLWLQGRENRKSERIVTVPEKKILTFKLDNINKGFFEIPYEEYSSWKAPTYPEAPTGGAPYSSFPHGNVASSSNRTAPAVTRAPDSGRVINIAEAKSRSGDPKLKAGELIVFELDDTSRENGAEVLLGYPVFEGEKDENIIVRTVLKQGDDPMKYFGLDKDAKINYTNKLWKAKIQHVRSMSGMLTLFVQDMEPYLIVVDAQGEQNSHDEVKSALASGCSRCHVPVNVDDVQKSIVRKRADGTYRIVCPKCLTTSITQARNAKPGVSIALN